MLISNFLKIIHYFKLHSLWRSMQCIAVWGKWESLCGWLLSMSNKGIQLITWWRDKLCYLRALRKLNEEISFINAIWKGIPQLKNWLSSEINLKYPCLTFITKNKGHRMVGNEGSVKMGKDGHTEYLVLCSRN